MADKSGSPAFKPPMDHITDNDPNIVRVALDQVEFANRKSQQPKLIEKGVGPIRHLSNEN